MAGEWEMKAKSLEGDVVEVFLLDTLIMESLMEVSASESIVELTNLDESTGDTTSDFTAGVLLVVVATGVLVVTESMGLSNLGSDPEAFPLLTVEVFTEDPGAK